MLPQIKNILYATDLSENARYAYNYAASMGQQYGARITILHVIESCLQKRFSRFRDTWVKRNGKCSRRRNRLTLFPASKAG
jgi:nucleotide-binding universal stress UspA family protein